MTDSRALVLVVEDEPQMRRFIRASLDSNGCRVIETGLAAEAVALATGHNPDAVLLDLGLPDGDGIELARRLRALSRAPIIVISARGREMDKVAALDAGADDYLTKPFGVKELLARMRACLRRAGTVTAPGAPLEIGPLVIDLQQHEVRVSGREVHLTPTEYRLLVLMAQNAGAVLTYEQILREVWGPGGAGLTHHVRVHVAELRKKIEVDPARPALLVTEPGIGYRLREPVGAG